MYYSFICPQFIQFDKKRQKQRMQKNRIGGKYSYPWNLPFCPTLANSEILEMMNSLGSDSFSMYTIIPYDRYRVFTMSKDDSIGKNCQLMDNLFVSHKTFNVFHSHTILIL